MQDWLDQRYPGRFVVHEFPTVDARAIGPEVLAKVTLAVLALLGDHNTVVIMDSAGAQRTARVCEAIGYKKRN
jgi:hypothetical protein